VRCSLISFVLIASAVASAGEPTAPGEWWNGAWTHRKRVRVRLAPVEPLGFSYRPPQAAAAEDLIAAEAGIQCEVPLEGGAQQQIRVVDAGGNVLPSSADGPDAQGLVRVTFPARRTIAGQLAAPIQDGTKTVALSVGRDKAVTRGMRFHVLAGPDEIAALEVEAVEAKTSTARLIEKSVPAIAQGTPVRSAILTDVEYAIYYGNPKPEGEHPRWGPSVAPVNQYGWTITQGGVPTSATQLRDVMRASPSYVGSHAHQHINSSSNPLGYGSEVYSVSAYESLVYADMAGVWRFCIDSGGPAFLFLDGRLAAQRPGFYYQTGQFEHRGKIQLDEGYHHLLLCAVESASKPVTRLAWQPVTEKVFTLVPPSFFVNRVHGEVMGWESKDVRDPVFFTHRLAPRALVDAKKRPYQFAQFRNLAPAQATGRPDAVTYLWDFGDGEQSRDEAPGHLYALPEGGATASFAATLHVYVDGREVGAYKRTVHCPPRPQEKSNLALDIMSFASIVYADERTSIAARVRNASFSPVVLRAIARLKRGDDTQIVLNRQIPIQAKDENFCIIPVDMKQFADKRAIIDLELLLGGERVLDTSFRVMPSPEDIESLQRGLGALHDAEGRRVVICAEIEDPNRHLEWVFGRYIRETYIDQRQRVLLFGDRMSNLVAPDRSFTDYVALLEQRLKKAQRPFQFVPRSSGLLPTLADLVLFAKTLKELKPLPDILVICPGLSDVAQATGDRDFARSIDVMIDCIRATGHSVKIVIVSPPPSPRDLRMSRHYTDALERVAKDHHITFLRLDDVLNTRNAGWMDAYYADPETEGIYYENPNEAAQRRIADAIERLLD